MNKSRMREPFHTLIYKASIGYNDSWSNVDQEVLEKFAELIIQECFDIVQTYALDQIESDEHYLGESLKISMTVSEAAYKIKEHFGVK